MRVPWQGEQLRENSDAPAAICSGGNDAPGGDWH
jgi:hypothetical protein